MGTQQDRDRMLAKYNLPSIPITAEERNHPDFRYDDPTARDVLLYPLAIILITALILGITLIVRRDAPFPPPTADEIYEATRIAGQEGAPGERDWQDAQAQDYWESQQAVSGVDPATIDCPSFTTQDEAQIFFLYNDPNLDPYVLDWDHDGQACETLP